MKFYVKLVIETEVEAADDDEVLDQIQAVLAGDSFDAWNDRGMVISNQIAPHSEGLCKDLHEADQAYDEAYEEDRVPDEVTDAPS